MTPRVEVLIVLACYVVHAADLALLFHTPWDAFWACHVACLFVAVGIGMRSGMLAGIGVCFLVFGDALWLFDLATGGELLMTSILTHVVGLVFGVRAVMRHGFPAGTWWRAVLAMFGLLAVTRAVTPPAANVNLAFAVYPGWEAAFPTYPRYFLFLFVLCASTYLLTERGARFVLARTLAPETP